MPEDLEAFLGKNKAVEHNLEEVTGSFACQECNEVITKAGFDEVNSILVWFCSENHRSQVSL